MPVIVVGADTPTGEAIVGALLRRQGEVRAFVSDPSAGVRLKEAGAKVALGDVSDASHVAGASLNCFTAVLVTRAAGDGRERAFAATPEAVYAGWAEALADAGVRRAIWVRERHAAPDELPSTPTAELAILEGCERSPAELAAEVVRLDEAGAL